MGKGVRQRGRKGDGEIKKRGCMEEGRKDERHGLGAEKGGSGREERVGTKGVGGRKEGISVRYRRDRGSLGGLGGGGGEKWN